MKNNYPQQIKRLEGKIYRLELQNKEIIEEYVQRGIEITRMIKIMLLCENSIPEEKFEQFVETALVFASRCDKDRDLMNRATKLDFREGCGAIYGNEKL